MVQRLNGGELKEYHMKKGWSKRVIESIEWGGIGNMMNNASPLGCMKIV